MLYLLISLYRITNCFIEPKLESGLDEDADAIHGNEMKYTVEQSRINEYSIISIATFSLGHFTYFVGGGGI